VARMIKYDRLWATMKQKHLSQYRLIKDYEIDRAQLHRLRKNMIVKTITIDNLCRILDCNVEDIMEYVPDDPETK
jgi:putative transcriptional regulator